MSALRLVITKDPGERPAAPATIDPPTDYDPQKVRPMEQPSSHDRSYAPDRWGKVASDVMRCPVITMQAKALYGVLATYVGNRGDGHCWPSLATLGTDTGMSKPMLIRYLKELESVKVIEKVGSENNREIRLTGKVDLTAIDNRPKKPKKRPSGKAGLTGKVYLTATGKAHLTAPFIGTVGTGSTESVCESAGAHDPTVSPPSPPDAAPPPEEFNPYLLGNGHPTEDQVKQWAPLRNRDPVEAWDIALWLANRNWRDKGVPLERWDWAIEEKFRYREKFPEKFTPKRNGKSHQATSSEPRTEADLRDAIEREYRRTAEQGADTP